MNDLINIDGEIQKWAQEYDKLSNDYHGISVEASRLRDVYDLAKAKAMLNAPTEYKVDEKKAHVKLACEKQMSECHIAETTRDWYKERLRALAGLLTAVQSRANIVRDDLRTTNTRY